MKYINLAMCFFAIQVLAKNKGIDDYHIDRRNLTVILTCPPEDEEQLRAICSMCSYTWVGDISELM